MNNFHSRFSEQLSSYLKLRCGLGFNSEDEAFYLKAFDKYMQQRGYTGLLTQELALDFASDNPNTSTNYRVRRYQVVRHFSDYLATFDLRAAPDRSTKQGRRDHALLLFLGRTGAFERKHDDVTPSISESLGTGKTFRWNWARLIQKIYEIAPLVCPKCQGAMKIISFIEAKDAIEKILKHLGLWLGAPG